MRNRFGATKLRVTYEKSKADPKEKGQLRCNHSTFWQWTPIHRQRRGWMRSFQMQHLAGAVKTGTCKGMTICEGMTQLGGIFLMVPYCVFSSKGSQWKTKARFEGYPVFNRRGHFEGFSLNWPAVMVGGPGGQIILPRTCELNFK